MWPWIIGLGGGLLATAAVAITALLVIRDGQKQSERTDTRANELAKRLDEEIAKSGALEKGAYVLNTNISELKRELATKSDTIAELGARVASVEKARADLANVLKQNPGAVTAALSLAFDELRKTLSHAQAAAGAATGDPSRREDGAVHDGSDGGKPPG
jgi:chromosome segregation ATPase